ncbi:MAG: diphosphomevalonate decarboxylase [Spirochaetaceae bacterium]|nr:diphosphomevalonate decarboxylase [Spirochaetaceae bacterium]
MTVVAEASPSLALIKYWGKLSGGVNVPATSSLAVTLGALQSRSTISDRGRDGNEAATEDLIVIDGARQPTEPFLPVLNEMRSRARGSHAGEPHAVRVESSNNFPTAAGLASSSSGFAALVVGLDALFGTSLPTSELSSIARLGSGSAARAVYGGFSIWPAGAKHAEPLVPGDHWPDLRVLVVVLQTSPKAVSSRTGMERSRLTSPFYNSWVQSSETLFETAQSAVTARDLEKLGMAMRQSYLRMFSTMFTSDPPLIYWLPESLAVIRRCEELRARGIPVWETMDAGPQVKLLTLASHEADVTAAIGDAVPGAAVISSAIGDGPVIHSRNER